MAFIRVTYTVAFKVDEDFQKVWHVWIDLTVNRHDLSIGLKPRQYNLPRILTKGVLMVRSLLFGLVQRLADVNMPLAWKANYLVDYLAQMKQQGVTRNLAFAAVFGANKSQPKMLMSILKKSVAVVFGKK